MPCKDALLEKVLTVSPEQTVEQAVKAMKKSGVTFVPVVDEGNGRVLVGVFSLSRLLEDAMPVALMMSGDGSPLNVLIPSAPGMSRRIQKAMGDKIFSIMHRPSKTAALDTPLEEAVRMIRENGEPVPVTDPRTGAFLGLVTDESIFGVLGHDG